MPALRRKLYRTTIRATRRSDDGARFARSVSEPHSPFHPPGRRARPGPEPRHHAAGQPAGAAEGEIRIAEQFGIVYLLLNVVRDQLIEKHGQAEGPRSTGQLSGGAAVNDALLSGAIDIAGAGRRWPSRSLLPAEQRPAGQGIADFGAGDRIAVPAVGVSVQSRFLQYAAAKQWGGCSSTA